MIQDCLQPRSALYRRLNGRSLKKAKSQRNSVGSIKGEGERNMSDPITVSTLITVIGGGITYAFRELQKNKSEKKNNKAINVVKNDISKVKDLVEEIDKKAEKSLIIQEKMEEHCQETVNRFDIVTRQNQQDIKELFKKK